MFAALRYLYWPSSYPFLKLFSQQRQHCHMRLLWRCLLDVFLMHLFVLECSFYQNASRQQIHKYIPFYLNFLLCKIVEYRCVNIGNGLCVQTCSRPSTKCTTAHADQCLFLNLFVFTRFVSVSYLFTDYFFCFIYILFLCFYIFGEYTTLI